MNKTQQLLKEREEEFDKEFVEKGAELEHIRWAKWQNYLHSFLTWNDEIKGWVLPHEKKEWWDSEIRTPYAMLTEKQKESDRKETREYLPLIKSFHATTISLLLNSLKEEIGGIKTSKEYDAMVKMGDLSFLNYTPTQIYTKAISDISTILSETISNIQTK